MLGYRLWLEAPVQRIHLALEGVGRDLEDKDGVFTIRLLDPLKMPLSKEEVDLPVSVRLDESYRYLMSTKAGEPVVLGDLSASREFQGVELRYPGEFTSQPLDDAQFGMLFYTVEEAGGSIVRVVSPEDLGAGGVR